MTHGYPKEIQAALDPSVLERMTRMYKADAGDAFNELLQNARRAGARHVAVNITFQDPDTSKKTSTAKPVNITVSDDGCGIADPSILLTYGANGWDPKTTGNEDAAGMGFAALAALGCDITSWTQDTSQASHARLEPQHFQGKTPAPVNVVRKPEGRQGTIVSFTITSVPADTVARFHAAARYVPIPVYLTVNGNNENTAQRPFLDTKAPRAAFGGVTYAVMPKPSHSPLHDKTVDLNFHGLTLNANLPVTRDAWNKPYTACADATDCKDLQLVLPARKEAVENPFLKELRRRCRQHLLNAISNDPESDLTYAQFVEAKAFMDPKAARPMLKPWVPYSPDENIAYDMSKPEPVDPKGIICRIDAGNGNGNGALDLSLARAIKHTGLKLYEPNVLLKGYDWYDSRPALTQCDFRLSTGDQTVMLADFPVLEDRNHLPERPDRIECLLSIKKPDGAVQTLTCETDLILVSRYGGNDLYYGNYPIVTKSSRIDPQSLSQLLYQAFFYHEDDFDADSSDTQEDRFNLLAHQLAVHTLHGPTEGAKTRLRETACNYLSHLRPRDVPCAVIRIYEKTVTVEFTDDTKNPAS